MRKKKRQFPQVSYRAHGTQSTILRAAHLLKSPVFHPACPGARVPRNAPYLPNSWAQLAARPGASTARGLPLPILEPCLSMEPAAGHSLHPSVSREVRTAAASSAAGSNAANNAPSAARGSAHACTQPAPGAATGENSSELFPRPGCSSGSLNINVNPGPREKGTPCEEESRSRFAP